MTESHYSINNTTFSAGLRQDGRHTDGLQPTVINGFQRPALFSNQQYTSRPDAYTGNNNRNGDILDESTPYELLKEDLPYKRRRLDTKPERLPPLPPLSQITTRHIAHPKYGLPTSLVDGYRRLGIEEMYEWQAECLCLHPEILLGTRNLCFTAQTSAGKSLGTNLELVS